MSTTSSGDYVPPSEPAGISRRGTGVLVRLNDEALADLDALCAESGKTRPEVLRLGLIALQIGTPR